MANFILAFIDLMEAEGRSLRHAVRATGTDLMLVLFAGVLVTAGVLLVGWALYQYLLSILGNVMSALIVGLLITSVGGITIWRVRRKDRKA